MAKPYIDVYENSDGDAVIVYIPEALPNSQLEPSYIIIKEDHIKDVVSSLTEFVGD